MKTFVNQLITLIFSAALLSGVIACGGSDDGSVSSATTTENNPANTNNKDDENNLMFQQEKISPVIGAPLEEATVAPSPTIEKKVEATPTPTPPSKTIDEKSTGGLVDELSADDFTRTSARDLEKEFRKSPDTATPKIGKKFVVQGNVLEAGTDAPNIWMPLSQRDPAFHAAKTPIGIPRSTAKVPPTIVRAIVGSNLWLTSSATVLPE